MNFDPATLQMASLRKELDTNPRLRLGVWLIAVLVFTWLSLVWSDWNLALYENNRARLVQLESLSDIESEEAWESRRRDVAQLSRELRQQLWQAGTTGLAQAKLQTGIDRLVVREDWTSVSIRSGTPQAVDGLDGVYEMRVRLGCRLTPPQLMTTLAAIENHEKLLVIERLKLAKQDQLWNVELILSAYVELAEVPA